jgi:hypothetical protein
VTNLFPLQDEITSRIAVALKLEIISRALRVAERAELPIILT